MRYLASLFLLTLTAQPMMAKDKHLPLPPQIAKATTVYIDNQSGLADIGDRCYTQIEKWGRFKVVQNPKDADLILLLSAKEYTRGYVTSGGGSTSTVNTSGNQTTGTINTSGTVNTTAEPSYTKPVTVGYTYLTVIDPRTGDNLWSDSKQWVIFRSATKGLVDSLMKRINEDAKQSH